MSAQQPKQATHRVVVNHEMQYSIWPLGRDNAPGWEAVGVEGTKEDCLRFIEENWTDMRPMSVRQQLVVPRDGN
jgi:MbtH protein